MLPRSQTLARLLHHLGTQLNPEPLGGRGIVSVIRLPYQAVSTTCLDVRGRWIRQPEALGEGTERATVGSLGWEQNTTPTSSRTCPDPLLGPRVLGQQILG